MGKRWWLVVGAIGGAAIAGVIAWSLAGDDIWKPGDWRGGAARFVGMVTAIGGFGGYLVARQLAGRAPLARDGFTLSYARHDPKPAMYRELETTRVADLLARLTAAGYEPRTERCNDVGEPCGELAAETPLAGANFAIRDRGVRGHVRVQLAAPIEGRPRSLGLIEVWSLRGESAEELALFTLRALDGLLDGLQAARESSRLGDDPASLLTSALGERPVHRKS